MVIRFDFRVLHVIVNALRREALDVSAEGTLGELAKAVQQRCMTIILHIKVT